MAICMFVPTDYDLRYQFDRWVCSSQGAGFSMEEMALSYNWKVSNTIKGHQQDEDGTILFNSILNSSPFFWLRSLSGVMMRNHFAFFMCLSWKRWGVQTLNDGS